ncbi:MAG TPA: CCC motif membrane protein [Flavipsychrobacter sp.]|nr:CCC motif membrane protein [Flavipsychrobacter sp.]
MTDYTQPQQDFNQPQVALPNATAVLILGIIGIITCCCWGGGAILSIIALVLASRDMRLYRASPHAYTRGSYNNLNAGRICAIIALVFSLSYIVMMIVLVSTVGWEAMQNPDAMREALENM